MAKETKLTVLGHIAELRSRLLRSVIALVVAVIVALVFSDRIFQVLVRPLGSTPLIYIDMTEMLGVYMKVCLAAGIFLAMPYIVYQILMFVSPALTPRERRYIYYVLPWISFMFVGGVVFSYFVLLPPAINFLTGFGSDIAQPQIRISSYITVVTRVMLAAGVVFELPVITTFLARLGIISAKWLASKRKFAIVLAFVFGALITPTFDPINQSLVAGPLIILYEVSILLAKLLGKRRPNPSLEMPPAYSS
jgi:sec-independent protein translocase protein TatC